MEVNAATRPRHGLSHRLVQRGTTRALCSVLLLALWLTGAAQASPGIAAIEYWHDAAAEGGPASILAGDFDARFSAGNGGRLAPGTGWHWLRITLEPADAPRVLVVDNLVFETLRLHYLHRDDRVHRDDWTRGDDSASGDDWRMLEAGLTLPASTWPLPYRFFAFPLDIAAGDSPTLLLQARPNAPTTLSPAVLSREGFEQRSAHIADLSILLAGVVLGIGVYTLLLGIGGNGWQGLGYYAALMLTTGLTLLYLNGSLMPWLFDSVYLQQRLGLLLAALSGVFLFQFTRHLFSTPDQFPVIDVIARVCVGASLLFALSFLLLPPTLTSAWQVAVQMLRLLILIGFSLYWLRRQHPYARQYAIGIHGYLLLAIVFTLAQGGLISDNLLTRHAYEIGACLLGLMFASLLLQRLHHYRDEAFQLRTQTEIARAESRAKSDLLAVMSHEIRTPMTGVLGMVDLLRQTSLSDTQRFYTQTIQSSGRTLLSVINDILDFSKVEAGKLELEARPFDLAEVIEETVAPFRLRSTDRVILVASLAPDTPIHLIGDAIRLQQILANLLNNAFKFTSEGQITLRVEPGPSAAGRQALSVRVCDTGIGIAAEAQQHLFDPYAQAEAATARKYGGSGLGLAICKRLVSMMDGEIHVESTPGKGSCFHFTVWLQIDPTPAPPRQSTPIELRGRHMLAVDDRAEYLHILEEQARALGMRVTTAANGEEALAAIRRDPPDLVTIDLDMPGIDGFELDRAISGLPVVATVPRVLLTASSVLPRRQQLATSGFVSAHVKPTSASQLQLILTRALQEQQEPPEERSPGIALRGLCVLLAEDNPVNRRVLLAMLETLGVAVDTATNGLEAAAAATADHERYDLVLMDCEMPELDGYAATLRIRAHERSRGLPALPIVALTAHALPEHRERSQAAGMDAHLSKPVSLERLATLLERLGARQAD